MHMFSIVPALAMVFLVLAASTFLRVKTHAFHTSGWAGPSGGSGNSSFSTVTVGGVPTRICERAVGNAGLVSLGSALLTTVNGVALKSSKCGGASCRMAGSVAFRGPGE